MPDAFELKDRCTGRQCDHNKCTEQKRLEHEIADLRRQLEAERESLRRAVDEGIRPW